MSPELLGLLCDPIDQSDLTLVDEQIEDGRIQSGWLVSANGNRYQIRDGVPRFWEDKSSVESFGNEWNHFNYDLFHVNWMRDVVERNFGSIEYFKGRTIVDCGAGSGMQTKWMAEAGAKHVIALELSHAVDGVIRDNVRGLKNVDVVQCSIDAPPFKRGAIDGTVICHNVIQHTASVERTAEALWNVLGTGNFVFNCYLMYPDRPFWMARWALIYRPLRAVLSRSPFQVILAYARMMAALRFIPGLGIVLEKAQMVIRGDVPPGPHYRRRLYQNAVLNTFDWYGSHDHQNQKTPGELRRLVDRLQPEESKVRNLEPYLSIPLPPGLAIDISK